MIVHGGQISNHELDTVGVVDQEHSAGQAADVFFTLEQELRAATVGEHRPGTGVAKLLTSVS